MKQSLADLKAQRDEVDTLASAYSTLVATNKQAQSAYDEAMGDLATSRTRHNELLRIMRALPLAGEHAQLKSKLTSFAQLPHPPKEWVSELPQLTRDQTRIQTQIEGAEKELTRLQAEIDLIVVDEQLGHLADRIVLLEDGRARFRTAENDLPRRRAALAEQDAALSAILIALEQRGNPNPEGLLLPASVVGSLHELIETRSGIDAMLQTATRELTKAKQLLGRAEEEHTKLSASAGVIDEATTTAIETALTRLQRSDNQARLRVAERDRGPLSLNYDNLLSSLQPWSGDASDLRSIVTPEQRQIESWHSEALQIDKRLNAHKDRLRDLVTSQRDTKVRIEAIRTSAGITDDTEARQTRMARTEAWEEHRKHLSIATAEVFEQKMRADDEINETRLAHSRDVAELRQLTQALSINDAAIVREEELLVEVTAELAQLSHRIRAAIPPSSEVSVDDTIEDLLTRLERWSNGRKATLLACDALQQVESDIRQSKAELDGEVAALIEAMHMAGTEDVETNTKAH